MNAVINGINGEVAVNEDNPTTSKKRKVNKNKVIDPGKNVWWPWHGERCRLGVMYIMARIALWLFTLERERKFLQFQNLLSLLMSSLFFLILSRLNH